MTLTRPHFIDKAWPNAIDLRKNLGHAFPREGLFPAPDSVNNGIAYAGTVWGVNARAFVAAFRRQGTPYSLAYGAGFGANDGVITPAWTVGSAPGAGSRVDRLWVRWVDPTQGESTTIPGGETVARAVPVFGVTPGTPGLAALPAGVLEIAQVSVPSGAGSIAGATITQTYNFAQAVGGTIWVRTIAERDALVNVIEGDVAYVIGTDQSFIYVTSVGWVHLGGKPTIDAFTPTGIYSIAQTIRVATQGGRVAFEGVVGSSSATFVAGTSYSIGSIPAAVAPKDTQTFACSSNSTAVAAVTITSAGAMTISLSVGFTGALILSLAGITYALKTLV